MRVFVNAMLIASVLSYPCLAEGLEAAQGDHAVAERLTFHEVPLACPAARGLGCGSRAKPVLQALEREPAVEEAWLDRSGRIIAIVWRASSPRATREATLAAVSGKQKLSIGEVDAVGREKAAESFRSGKGWHRGADVDRLSEEEAGVIADRWWNRLVAKTPAVARKRDVVKPLLADAIRQCLLTSSRNFVAATLVASIRPHLDDMEVSALTESIEAGPRPIGNER